MKRLLSFLQRWFGIATLQEHQTSNDNVARSITNIENKATHLATRVAQLEGRIDPLIAFLNEFHGPAHLDSSSIPPKEQRSKH